ncbi:hypothetical protein FOZ60_004764 [Perkinsus olseni]|uniref:Uncharacterized protein n=1 Tax=Perkinsus olseni TaxID=32597 RepID=A0A7J6NTB9_PEROL|nr:hypothetical protein FOZ60_004764 [Perkinsus olseni]
MMLALLSRAVLNAALLATGSATVHVSPASVPPLPDPGYYAPDSHQEGVSGVTIDSMVIEEVAQSGHKMKSILLVSDSRVNAFLMPRMHTSYILEPEKSWDVECSGMGRFVVSSTIFTTNPSKPSEVMVEVGRTRGRAGPSKTEHTFEMLEVRSRDLNRQDTAAAYEQEAQSIKVRVSGREERVHPDEPALRKSQVAVSPGYFGDSIIDAAGVEQATCVYSGVHPSIHRERDTWMLPSAGTKLSGAPCQAKLEI